MGLSIRTIDDGRVSVIDTNLDSEPAIGTVNLVTDTNRYSCGDEIQFDGQSRTEVVSKTKLSNLINDTVKQIIDIREYGYVIKNSDGEIRDIKISEIN